MGDKIKNVTVAGITGAIGSTIIHALGDAGFQVQALTRRSASPKPDLGGATVVPIDYTDRHQLEHVLKGQDAVISTLGDTAGAVAAQQALIEASVAAGVSRFIPSEFGSDTLNPPVRTFPFFEDKLQHQELLKRAMADHPTFSYSIVITGPFLDWGLSVVPFIVNVANKEAQRFDGGDVPFSATRVPTLATALVNLLRKPEATKNRALYIHDTITTQNQLLACAERLDDDLSFSDETIDMHALEMEAWAYYHDPDADPLSWVFSFINISMWSRGELCAFHSNHNDMLGVKELNGAKQEAVIETEVAKAISVFASSPPHKDQDQTDCRAAEKAFEEGRSKLREFVKAN